MALKRKHFSEAACSSSSNLKYQVFLSFRGEDTRKNFTDHLYTSLVNAGINTFRDDDQLQRGKIISSELLKAVQQSKISLVIWTSSKGGGATHPIAIQSRTEIVLGLLSMESPDVGIVGIYGMGSIDDRLKDMFLDIACFFIGMDEEYVMTILKGCGYFPVIDVRFLVERSLLIIEHHTMRMHNLLRDMGREIVREMSPSQIGKSSRLWFHLDSLDILRKHTGTKAVEGLSLDVSAAKDAILIETEAFANMINLRLLKINSVHFTTTRYENFSKELRWLYWHRCSLQVLPPNLDLGSLVVLDMRFSNFRKVWKETKFLDKLKILDLSYSIYLVETPNFAELRSLERLQLEGCTSLTKVHQSIGDLKRLLFLNLAECNNLKELPDSICKLKSLQTLNLNGCSRLNNFPEDLSWLEALRELRANRAVHINHYIPKAIIGENVWCFLITNCPTIDIDGWDLRYWSPRRDMISWRHAEISPPLPYVNDNEIPLKEGVSSPKSRYLVACFPAREVLIWYQELDSNEIFFPTLCSSSLDPMASESSSNSSTTPTINTNAQTIQQNNGLPPLITINAAAQLPIKLSSQNFPSWRAQFTSLLTVHRLSGYIDGSKPCPPPLIPSEKDANVEIPNPAYDHWIQQDQLLLHGIIASATETVIPFFASCTSSKAAWTKIQNMYANRSRSRMMQLREKLIQPRGSRTVQEYFQLIRHTADELALINSPIHDDELVIHVLNGIGAEYREISAGIRARESPISFDELLDKMTEYEAFIQRQTSTDAKIICQICDKYGHIAKTCNKLRQKQESGNVSAHTATIQKGSSNWLLDTGASHHVTSEARSLQDLEKYGGNDELVIGDGSGLPITHTGSISIPTKHKQFHLHNVLLVPNVDINLCLVSKFCKTNSASVEFFPHSYAVKDLFSRKIIAQGRSREGIYELQSADPIIKTPSLAFVGTKTSSNTWHQRLGHPNSKTLNFLIKNFSLPCSNKKINSLCNSCLCNKIHKLPFASSTITSSGPLEVIYSDVWSPSRVTSVKDFRYYVSFVDHFTKYTWCFPLKQKSEVLHVFTKFKTSVEKFFKLDILTVYSDCRGEYEKLKPLEELRALETNGTWTLVPPPANANVVKCKCVFRIKRNPDGSISRYKARLVAKGFTQRPGLDFNETFSPVVKPITRPGGGLFLSQHKYVADILAKTDMAGAKAANSPMSTTKPLHLHDGSPAADAETYRKIIGSLQYLCLTRPDITFAVNRLSQFMHKPTQQHFAALKRLLRYLKGTIWHGININKETNLSLTVYTNSDWAGDPDDRRSTSAYIVQLGTTPIAWCSKKQSTIARSSTEAEYRAIATAVSEVLWKQSLLSEIPLQIVNSHVTICKKKVKILTKLMISNT
ncbi:hypothetical protein CCACVL1_02371 [Corchorus capsularis]|uniref:TIR domain-containing protein n=1 Tax=Corchorus capsularis TaxID=210143 RepID=A0A1R3K8Y6_COCAP|nr:hypothetical protein CCACVL1_02371 [Corchorus capsularis]